MNQENITKDVEAAVSLYLSATKVRPSQDWRDDLTQETHLVLLEGYGGAKVEGKLYFAVQMAATRLGFSNACGEDTGHDFSIDEGATPSGRRNTDDDYVSQLEVDDWVEAKLDRDQQFIVKHLVEGYTQADIASKVGVSQQAISLRVAAIQEIAKEDFNVN